MRGREERWGRLRNQGGRGSNGRRTAEVSRRSVGPLTWSREKAGVG